MTRKKEKTPKQETGHYYEGNVHELELYTTFQVS